MSIQLLEAAATTLGELVHDVIFVGGATIPLWITDPAAPPARPTKDVDVIVEVTTRTAYYDFETKLRERRFRQDQHDGVICRWHEPVSGLILDAMPADATILGFANQWQSEAAAHAARLLLPSQAEIRAASPPYLLAMKFDAFSSRGRGDFMSSRDFADIIALVDGRDEILDELRSADDDLQRYVSDQVRRATAAPRFADGLLGNLLPDPASQSRAGAVILPRLRAIASLA